MSEYKGEITTQESINVICGNVIRLGDYINTDLIYPGAYLQLSDPAEISKHALEGLGKDYPRGYGKGTSSSEVLILGVEAPVKGL